MAIMNYGTVASRNLIRAAQGMLEHAQPSTVLGDFGTQREMPQNSTDTLVFRRTLPFGASTTGTTIENTARYVGTPSVTVGNFVLAEGATPNANTSWCRAFGRTTTLFDWVRWYEWQPSAA